MPTRFRELLSESPGSGPSKVALDYALTDLVRVSEVIECLSDDDKRISGLAWTVLERVSRADPSLAQQARQPILNLVDAQEPGLSRMSASRLCPLITWPEEEYERILAFLLKEVERNEGFVAAWALDALARLAVNDDSIRARVLNLLEDAEATGSAAVRARARKSAKNLRSFTS